ncbi:MAG: dephospho-CoA kinase [Bacteroidia bacterium]|nr:dephospho-CoA kinase [Bacteroidia bacterium]
MYKVGLTGGMGSGKSFIANIFETFDIPIYYADARAKDLMYRHKPLKQAIKSLLGTKAYHRNGRINRPFIANAIFRDKKLLKGINALVHPAVKSDFEHWAEQQTSNYVIEESAILFEINGQSNFDAVILVIADLETKIQRIICRDGLSRGEIKSRMKNQFEDSVKIPLADFIIENSGNKSILQQVLKIHKEILKKI